MHHRKGVIIVLCFFYSNLKRNGIAKGAMPNEEDDKQFEISDPRSVDEDTSDDSF